MTLSEVIDVLAARFLYLALILEKLYRINLGLGRTVMAEPIIPAQQAFSEGIWGSCSVDLYYDDESRIAVDRYAISVLMEVSWLLDPVCSISPSYKLE